MGGYADIYVIKKTRSKKLGLEFLNFFLPQREESAEQYLIPQYSDNPKSIFNSAYKLMEFLEENTKIEHSLYWRNIEEGNPNCHGMIFYTTDSYMIFGISRESDGISETRNEDSCLSEMKRFLLSNEGYITYECPPESTHSNFLKVVRRFNKDN